MTTISDERLAELVGFHKTVPFRSEHDDELVAALTELRSLRAQGGVRVRAYVKRNAPGHDGDGGEVVVPFETDADMRRILASLEASPAPVSEEMVLLRAFANSFHITVVEDSFYKDVTLHLDDPHALSIRIRNDSSKSWIFKDLEKRRRAALAAKGGQ